MSDPTTPDATPAIPMPVIPPPPELVVDVPNFSFKTAAIMFGKWLLKFITLEGIRFAIAHQSSLDALTKGFETVEFSNRRVSELRMNAEMYAHMRRYHTDLLDIVTDAATLRSGHFATLWGAKVIIDRNMTPKKISFL